jgi:hypothetical protein
MPQKNRKTRELKAVAPRGSRAVIVTLIVLSLFAGWTLLAYSGALDPILRQKKKSGGAVSIQSFNSNSPSKEYIYAGGRLVATEEPTAVGCTPPTAPVLTTSVVNSVITLNWTVPAGLESFDVERSQGISAPFSPVASNLSAATYSWPDTSVGFSTVNPDGANSVVTYIYRVSARIGQCTTPSNLDWATNINFAEVLTPQQTLIKAHHITELRVAVNSVWKAANQTPQTIIWAEPPSGTAAGLAGFQIKKSHVEELRAKLNQAMDAIQAGYSVQNPYTDPTLFQGSTQVKAIHLVELRDRVK